MDFCPRNERGFWNGIHSITRFGWSGSAVRVMVDASIGTVASAEPTRLESNRAQRTTPSVCPPIALRLHSVYVEALA